MYNMTDNDKYVIIKFSIPFRHFSSQNSCKQSRSRSPRSLSPPPNRSPARSESPLFDDCFEDDRRSGSPDSWDDQRSITSTLALLETPTKTSSLSHVKSHPVPSSSGRDKSKRWNINKISLLCSMWEENPHLFDVKHKDYRNKKLRTETIDRFAAILNLDYDEVLTRMRSLRTMYRKTLMQKPSGSGAETTTLAQKQIIELCEFLKPYLQNRDSKSNLPKITSTKSTTFSAPPDCDDDVVDIPHESPMKSKTPKKKAMVEYQVMSDITKCMTSVAGMVTSGQITQSKITDEQDVHVTWAKLLANKLSKLEEMDAEELKHEIDGMVLEKMREIKK